MSTYRKMEEVLKHAHELAEFANEQLAKANRQEAQLSEVDYTNTQQLLEEMNLELEKMIKFANHEQRYNLHKAQQMIQDSQNEFVLGVRM
ncbi:DUF2524 family protein [Pseudalkalibacillus caeni]|uniref:DUF2524 family protein n=1 Tax=Exobacillus caeni TaxID=2574798 RepID=A0A5R9F586_9BACL|nr:DUF2524 family protein [Pseudalkalibacillus caeni]TLS37506.1 DUF2524 family protein [Pseudalkalibacillus caeni]